MKINIPNFETDGLPKLICITVMEYDEQGRAVYSAEMEDGHYEKIVLSSQNNYWFKYGYDMATRHYNEDLQEWFKKLPREITNFQNQINALQIENALLKDQIKKLNKDNALFYKPFVKAAKGVVKAFAKKVNKEFSEDYDGLTTLEQKEFEELLKEFLD